MSANKKKAANVKSNNSEETPAANESAVEKRGPSAAMLALFGDSKVAERLKQKRLTKPRLVLPKTIPTDGVVFGYIRRVVDSPNSAVKGKCLWLEHPKSGVEFLFPLTGVIRSALAGNADQEEISKVCEPHIGNVIVAKKNEPIHNQKYDKDMHSFDVFVLDADKDSDIIAQLE